MKITIPSIGTPCIILYFIKQALTSSEIQDIVSEGNYMLIRTKSQGLLTSSISTMLFSDSLETFNIYLHVKYFCLI